LVGDYVQKHCEGEGGTGSASYKGYNNAICTYDCYTFVTYRNENILKAGERVRASFTRPN